MHKLIRILKWVVVVIACLIVAIQFIRPVKSNPAITQSQTLQAHLSVTPQVAAILDRSCNDCHSSATRWPWYSNVAPVSWFVIDHVNEGRANLNFSEWGRYSPREARGLLDQICKEVKAEAMPLSSYTPLHPGSKLSVEDRTTLCDWANSERERIAAR
jgi:hypothetical protein